MLLETGGREGTRQSRDESPSPGWRAAEKDLGGSSQGALYAGDGRRGRMSLLHQSWECPSREKLSCR